MRTYSKNSPQAAARILALAVLADGQLQPSEISILQRARAATRLGLQEDEFDAILKGLCKDLLTTSRIDASAHCNVSPTIMRQIFAEVENPWLRAEVARLVVDIIRADRRLHRGESVLLQSMLRYWPRIDSDCESSAQLAHFSPPSCDLQIRNGV